MVLCYSDIASLGVWLWKHNTAQSDRWGKRSTFGSDQW